MRALPARPRRPMTVLLGAAVLAALLPVSAAGAQTPADPRAGLAPGTEELGGSDATAITPKRDAGTVSQGVQLLASRDKPAYTGVAPAFNYSNINSDLAFAGKYAYSGNYRGFGVYDVSDPAAPTLKATVNCPGGQGDPSVVGNLLFLSVESGGRVDCGTPVTGQPAELVFRGVRIFDISDPLAPRYVTGVQTCRGSHTHTVVEDPDDTANVYIYNSGTAGIRPATQLAGCAPASTTDPATSAYKIDVIQVPLAAPATARVVSGPRLMSSCGGGTCPGGTIATLNPGGVQPTLPPGDPRAPGGQRVAATSACHDITVYPAIGLAAAACQGDGLLLDIRDPANPVRIANVTDPNFAYWHSATFNDAGTKVVFTDEWGGGVAANCQPGQPQNWGANAIFDIVDSPSGKQLAFRSYYKIPNVQAANETCVAHNGNLVPVPGRDVMVQAWYEGGTSVFDFTDSRKPAEIAFFDRGPYHPTVFHEGGYWSTYWYNGNVFGNEIFLGFDSFGLTGTAALSANEIAAAGLARAPELNAQAHEPVVHAPSFTLVRARYDQAVRSGALAGPLAAQVAKAIDRAESFDARGKKSATATLRAQARRLSAPGQQPVAVEMLRLADSL